MAYVTRTKADPGDVGLAADQQQSIDNEEFLYGVTVGESVGGHAGIVKGFIHKSGIVDNTATEVCTITTTNETGSDDGGAYFAKLQILSVHGAESDDYNACIGGVYLFSRAMTAAGVGENSSVTEAGETAAAESDGGTQRGITTVTMTVVETSEYVQSVRFQINLDGADTTTAHVSGLVTVNYDGFTTVPVITSAE